MKRIDLDDLEQRARASLAGLRAGVDCTVALALIAYIRELEDEVRIAASQAGDIGYDALATRLFTLLEKGAVLP